MERMEKLEKVEKTSKERWWVPIAILITLIALIAIGRQIPSPWGIGLQIIGGVLFVLFLFNLAIKKIAIRVPYGEAWIIDRRGKVRAAEPGYHIFIPYLDYERIAAKIQTRQYAIHLFEDLKEKQKEIWIDLAKGGEIKLHDPRFWIKAKDPLKAYTTAANFERQLREMVENRMTGAINAMTYEEIMELRVPRALLKTKEARTTEGEIGQGKEAAKGKIKRKIDEIIEASEGIKKFLEEIGCEYKGFTLDDFDFDEATTRRRRERILTEMSKTIARNAAEAKRRQFEVEAKARAAETVGTVIEMMAKSQGVKPETIRDKINKDPEMQKEFRELAKDLIIRKLAIEGGAYVDIRLPEIGGKGGNAGESKGFIERLVEGLTRAIVTAIAASQRMPGGKTEEKKELPEEEKKDEEGKKVKRTRDMSPSEIHQSFLEIRERYKKQEG